MPDPQPDATPPAAPSAPPGSDADAPRSAPAPNATRAENATRVDNATRDATGMAAPAPARRPPSGAAAPPRRDPTLHLPVGELHDPESITPVDPWAGTDAGGWEHHPPPLPPTRQFPGEPGPAAHAPAHPAPPPTPGSPAYEPGSPAPHAPVSPPQAAVSPPQAAVSPPQAAVSPPQAPVPPPYRQPPPPTYPPPTYPPRAAPSGRRPLAGGPPPGWRPPPGYVPAPVRRRRSWPGVMMTLTLLGIACCCGVPAWFAKPMWEQYPASATVPANVADLELRDDPASAEDAARLAREMRGAHWLAEDTFAGVYSAPGDKRITVFGATGFRISPESDVDDEMTRLSEQFGLTEVQTVETGIRGEYQRCGVGTDGGETVVVCAWADHGSLAAGVFTRLSVDDSARLLGELRTWIVQRG